MQSDTASAVVMHGSVTSPSRRKDNDMKREYTRLSQSDQLKRDNLLVDELRKHRGSDNCITAVQVSKFLGDNGYPTKQNGIGTLVNRLMTERCLPICYINGKGYYWASNRRELEATINDLQSRINALNEHIDHLKSFIIE